MADTGDEISMGDAKKPRERVFLLAWPDAAEVAATRRVLESGGFEVVTFDEVAGLCDSLPASAVTAIVFAEASASDVWCTQLADCLASQPAWSDLPVILLVQRSVDATPSAAASRAEMALANLVIVERPGGAAPLLSAISVAARSRRRQHEAHDHFAAQQRAVDALAAATTRLEQQARLLDAIAAATPDMLSIFDPAGRIIYANPSLLALWNRSSLDEVRGKTMHDMGLPAAHVRRRERDFSRIVCTGTPETTESAWPDENQPSIFYETTLSPIFSPGGIVEAIAGTTRDVTERRRREDRDALLVRLDDATRALTDPDAISRAGVQLLGEHLHADRCAYADVEPDQDTFHFTGDYCRTGVASIIGRFRYSDFGEGPRAALLRGEPYVVDDAEREPLEVRHRETYRAAGIRAVIRVPLLKDGKLVAGIGIHQSTPRVWRADEVELARIVALRCWESIQRARVARDLSESEHRLRMALQTGRLGVWEVDLRTLEMTCSDSCKLNYGHPVGEPFTYEQLWNAVHPEDRAPAQANLRRSIERHTDYNAEYRVLVRGEARWVLMRGRATYAGMAGVPARMIGVSVDITERKTEEERRVRSLEAEQQLRVAAEAASQLKDEFLATLSHELRTPLSAILGWSQILRRSPQQTPTPAALAEGLATIERNARAQTRIIEDLLDMSRIMSGKVSLDARPIDLASIVAAAVDTVKPTSAAKDVEIRFDAPTHSMVILGDQNRLQQVFWNLLTNAVKFTPRGGKIEIRTTLDRDSGDARWRIDVSDSGEGIRADFLPHVFDRFRQADASTTRRHGGLGLGLSIVKQLAELHGGSVGVASDGPGRGAVFSVWIPALAADEGSDGRDSSRVGAHSFEFAQGSPEQAAPWSDVRSRQLAGLRALIVDDEPDARSMLRQVLESCDVIVFDAPSAVEALVLVGREPFDVIVSDIGMPIEDGHSLIRTIRAMSPAPAARTPAVALTAYARTEDRTKALAAGFDLHVAKPVEPAALLDAVAMLAGRPVVA